LQRVPERLIEVAIEVVDTGPEFVDGAMNSLIESFPGERERIEEAAKRARIGFVEYKDFLEHEARNRIGGSFAIGERWMYFKLEREHLVPMNCAALEAFGREHVESTRRQIEEAAQAVDKDKSWRELIE